MFDQISDYDKRAAVGQYSLLTWRIQKKSSDVALESQNAGRSPAFVARFFYRQREANSGNPKWFAG